MREEGRLAYGLLASGVTVTLLAVFDREPNLAAGVILIFIGLCGVFVTGFRQEWHP